MQRWVQIGQALGAGLVVGLAELPPEHDALVLAISVVLAAALRRQGSAHTERDGGDGDGPPTIARTFDG